jgi:ABC-type lipoprotein release transport system permease subunit
MVYNDSLINVVSRLKNVGTTVPRLEYFALASSGMQTKGVMVIGTEPVKEDALTRLSSKMVKGNYLDMSGRGVIVAQGLSRFLGLHTGDTLILIGQGFHGVSAAGKFPVRGIIHLPSPPLDNQVVYMNLPTARDFFSADNRITSLSISLKNPDDVGVTLKELKSAVNLEKLEVMPWDELMVEVMQQLKVKTASGLIIISILYMIVGFGIFGTVIMMTNERTKEFGVMVSLGMQKSKLAMILVLEMIFIGLTGALSGVAAALPIMAWYNLHPIRLWGSMAQAYIAYGIEPLMPLALKWGFIIGNVTSILVIVLLTCIFPVRRAFKLKVVEALHK